MNLKQELIERFTRYVKIDTQSNEESHTVPTTPGQIEFGKLLVEELKEIGLTEVTMDDNGYVMATLPANTDKDVPVIGFLAHLDIQQQTLQGKTSNHKFMKILMVMQLR